MGEKAEAIRNCDKVLEKNPKNVKALYRKAQAQQMFKDFEEAIETYKIVLELEPENKVFFNLFIEPLLKAYLREFRGHPPPGNGKNFMLKIITK